MNQRVEAIRRKMDAMDQSKLIQLFHKICIIMLVCTQLLFIGVAVNLIITSNVKKDQVNLINAANQFMNGSAYLTDEVRAYAATGNRAHYDNYMREVNEDKNRDKGYEIMNNIGLTDTEQKMIEEMSAISNGLVPLEENAIKDAENSKRDEALDYVYGKQYMTEITKIHSLQKDFLLSLDTRTERKLNVLTIGNFVLAFIAILFLFASMGCLWYTQKVLKKRIIGSVLAVRNHCQLLAKGDLTTKIPLKEDDTEIGQLVKGINNTQNELKAYVSELGRLLSQIAQGDFTVSPNISFQGDFVQLNTSIQSMLKQLNHTMQNIRSSAEQVSISANEVSLGAMELANGATTQAESISALDGIVQDIAANAKENAGTVQDAYKHTHTINEAVEVSNVSMQQMLDAMHQIQVHSEGIKNIIISIEDIAQQTNILSLNAAIEAERAGESGKGFSVVADEIRKLANQTTISVKSITDLIQDSLQAVTNGSEIAKSTAQSMHAVVAGTNEIEQTIEQISAISNNQANSILKISTEISQIASVVETNSATSEEAAAASVELSEQSNKMNEMIGQFKCR